MSKIYFEEKDLYEMGEPHMFMDGKARPRFSYEQRVINDTNQQLLANFQKVAAWIKANCPKLNGEFHCRHQVYHKTDLTVVDGIAYLQHGSHAAGYQWTLSEFGTDHYSQGSCQHAPYRFSGHYGMPNGVLEEFLTQWPEIKSQIVSANAVQTRVFSNDFEA